MVLKAQHYNTHPSGVECIRVIRGLNYDMGAAFKYVFRRHGKEFERSLKSALYYLRDQQEHRMQVVLDWHCVELIGVIINAETNVVAQNFYKAFLEYCKNPKEVLSLQMEACIETLIDQKGV